MYVLLDLKDKQRLVAARKEISNGNKKVGHRRKWKNGIGQEIENDHT